MKVSEIRPEHTVLGQAAAIEEDVAWLLKRGADFVDVACPACLSRSSCLEFERKGLRYWRCDTCGTVYINPRPTSEMLETFYARSAVYRYWSDNIYDATADNRRRLMFRPRAELLVDRCRKAGLQGAAMVEVGASQGLFCEEVNRFALFDRIIGIELTPDQARVCRAKGFETHEISYDKTNFGFKANAIASFETIEHLFSPEDFLEWAWSLLNPGGYLMLTCPNIAGFEAVVLGPHSGAIDHEHLNYFTPSSITVLLERQGFEDVEVTTPGHLDVEIVQDALAKGKVSESDLGPFLATIARPGNDMLADEFQMFLQRAGLSSNMMILARKARR